MTKTPPYNLPALIIGWLAAGIKGFADLVYRDWRSGSLPVRHCEYCGGRDLSLHQVRPRTYQEKPRDQYPGGIRPKTPVMRIACHVCGRTFTVLPSFLRPHELWAVRKRQEAVQAVLEAGEPVEAVSRALGYVARGVVQRWLLDHRQRLSLVRARLQQMVAEQGDEATVRCSGTTLEILRGWTAGLITRYEPFAAERWWEQLNFLLAQNVVQGRRPGAWLVLL